jgi:hypothetical protein
LAVVGRDVISG